MMNVGKKILYPKIFPLDKDLTREWQVRFYTEEVKGLKKHVKRVPVKLLTITARELWAKEYLERIEKGEPVKVEKTANTHIDRLFEVIAAKKIADKTRSTYLGHVRGLDKYCKKFKIRTVTDVVAVEFLEYLLQTLEGRTVNHYRRTLKELFGILKKKKLVKSNPFLNTDVAPTQTAFSEHYDEDDLKTIIAKVKEDKPFLLLPMLTIYYCFVRNGRELPHIRIKDIDFKRSKIEVDNTYSKNHKRESVLIPKQLMKAFLDAKLDTYPPQYFAFGLGGQPQIKPVSQNYYQNHFRKILEETGLYKKGKGIYRMKNTGNVALVKANFNRTAIQKQNRHASFATTEAYVASLRVDDFMELKDSFPTL